MGTVVSRYPETALRITDPENLKKKNKSVKPHIRNSIISKNGLVLSLMKVSPGK